MVVVIFCPSVPVTAIGAVYSAVVPLVAPPVIVGSLPSVV